MIKKLWSILSTGSIRSKGIVVRAKDLDPTLQKKTRIRTNPGSGPTPDPISQ